VTVCLLHPISKGQPGVLCILKLVEAVHLARSMDNTPSRQFVDRVQVICCMHCVDSTASTIVPISPHA
jgi:hypothetical protein